MFDALFQALFSYRPVVFQQGEFRFDVTSASLVAALVAAVVGGVAIFTYRRVQVTDGRLRDASSSPPCGWPRWASCSSACSGPTLVVRAAVNQQNVVAVLLDDSRSMQIPDVQRQAARRSTCASSSARRRPAAEVAGRAVPGARLPLLVGGARACSRRRS